MIWLILVLKISSFKNLITLPIDYTAASATIVTKSSLTITDVQAIVVAIPLIIN